MKSITLFFIVLFTIACLPRHIESQDGGTGPAPTVTQVSTTSEVVPVQGKTTFASVTATTIVSPPVTESSVVTKSIPSQVTAAATKTVDTVTKIASSSSGSGSSSSSSSGSSSSAAAAPTFTQGGMVNAAAAGIVVAFVGMF